MKTPRNLTELRFRLVSIVLNNENHLEPDGTAGQPAVGFWCRPLGIQILHFKRNNCFFIVLFIIFCMFSSISKKAYSSKVPPSDVLHHTRGHCSILPIQFRYFLPIMSLFLFTCVINFNYKNFKKLIPYMNYFQFHRITLFEEFFVLFCCWFLLLLLGFCFCFCFCFCFFFLLAYDTYFV